ncbi:unnamed protein product [Nyctereutes procyonoides]|uniref:(raccoon dog) hypothetical protein n=1 Tax=Nyctereutes procyonoides TaxID=34880 RepID=A0A812A080_NYCPR|nr:unnamed protein product [Nyctereutes procyonoides]
MEFDLREKQREKQAPYWEPDVGLDPGTAGSRPGPKREAETQAEGEAGSMDREPDSFCSVQSGQKQVVLGKGKREKKREKEKEKEEKKRKKEEKEKEKER